MKLFTTIFLSALLFCASASFADVPQSISLQGRLLDASGNILTDGNYSITIKLYTAPEGGTASAMYIQDVALRHGIFSTELGSKDIPLPEFDKEYWVGITVGNGTEMTPRIKLNSTPYTFHAAESDESSHAVHADTAGFAMNGVPVGTILIYGGAPGALPEGWMVCDGSAMNSERNPELFRVLGKAWGDGSADADDATDFNLPDLRGMFVRGVDDSTGRDPDAYLREASGPNGNAGDKVGSIQSDASPALGRDYSKMDQGINFKQEFGPVRGSRDRMEYHKTPAAEVRPKNAGVYYIIKVTH